MEHNLVKLEANLEKELGSKEFKSNLEAWTTQDSNQDLDCLEHLVKCKVQCKIIMEQVKIQQDKEFSILLLKDTLLNSSHLE